MIIQNKRLFFILFAAAVLLSLPLIAMQITTAVNWSAADFALAAVLLFGTGLTCELVLRKVRSSRSRFILCAFLLLVLLVVWAELAVGVFGTPFAGN